MDLLAPLLIARNAMATRFEFVLHGRDPVALRAAAEEALDEIERVENQLSLYRPHTDIARVNAGAASAPVRVAPETFRLLEHAFRLSASTGGAFDITSAPLLRAWGFIGGTGRLADPAALAEARACVGSRWVELEAAQFTVRFARAGVMLDLGSVGKGYALDRAAEIVREAGVTSALLHGGTSTAVAIGAPPGTDAWLVALPGGSDRAAGPGSATSVALRDEALSVSAVWGKAFRDAAGRLRGHVVDPRTGEPVAERRWAAAALPSAAASDCFSTALLVAGEPLAARLQREQPGIRVWLGQAEDDRG
jgi:thiamine biosynthesis lipoprotein